MAIEILRKPEATRSGIIVLSLPSPPGIYELRFIDKGEYIGEIRLAAINNQAAAVVLKEALAKVTGVVLP